MKVDKKVGWKAYLGSGLVMVGSAMAGWDLVRRIANVLFLEHL